MIVLHEICLSWARIIFLGDRFASAAWAGATAFADAELKPLVLGGAETGAWKNVGPLTWVEVE
jgi:hypothetical protein